MFIFVVIAAKKRREKLSAGSTGLLGKALDLKGMDVRISAFVDFNCVVGTKRRIRHVAYLFVYLIMLAISYLSWFIKDSVM